MVGFWSIFDRVRARGLPEICGRLSRLLLQTLQRPAELGVSLGAAVVFAPPAQQEYHGDRERHQSHSEKAGCLAFGLHLYKPSHGFKDVEPERYQDNQQSQADQPSYVKYGLGGGWIVFC